MDEENSYFFNSGHQEEDQIDCSKLEVIFNYTNSTQAESVSYDFHDKTDDIFNKLDEIPENQTHLDNFNQNIEFDMSICPDPSCSSNEYNLGHLDSMKKIYLCSDFTKITSKIFDVAKINIKKLAIKAKIIYLKNQFIKSLNKKYRSAEISKYFRIIDDEMKSKKQNYNREHVDLVLSLSIQRFILNTLKKQLDDKQAEIGLQSLCSGMKIGNETINERHTFLDFYIENKITEKFCESKDKSKWRLHRGIPLNELIEGVYSRSISEKALKNRTELIKKSKDNKLIRGLQSSEAIEISIDSLMTSN